MANHYFPTLRIGLLTLATALPAFVPLTSAHAQDARFAGSWRIAAGSPAPWLEPGQTVDAATIESYVGQVISFSEDSVDAPHPFGCGNAKYETMTQPPEGLFQGALDPATAAQDAAAIGIEGETITLSVACDTGLFDYHLAGDKLLTALDNVIYTLERQPD